MANERSRDDDARWLRRSFELAMRARERGDAPFGAVLVAADGTVLAEGHNTATSAADPTGHAELNLLRGLFARVDRVRVADATLYASGEPCPMCAAAISWATIPRVVYSVPSARLSELLRGRPGPTFALRAADVLASASFPTQLDGPRLQEEGERVFGLAAIESVVDRVD